MIDLRKLQKIVSNAPTAQALREMGLNYIPVTPSGEIEEEVIAAYITAGQPAGRFFQGHKLVTPDAWEAMRRAPAKSDYDPIDGHQLSEAESAAWAAKAPVKLPHGKGTVAMASLLAFGAAEGNLPPDLTSTLARLMLPKGADPIDPPDLLGDVALDWTYNPRAAEIAQRRLSEGGGATPGASMVIAGSISTVNMGSVAPPAPVRTTGSPASRLADLLMSLFGKDELRRFITYRVNNDLIKDLPDGTAAISHYAYEAADLLRRRGLIGPALFDSLLAERPGRHIDINNLRASLGV